MDTIVARKRPHTLLYAWPVGEFAHAAVAPEMS